MLDIKKEETIWGKNSLILATYHLELQLATPIHLLTLCLCSILYFYLTTQVARSIMQWDAVFILFDNSNIGTRYELLDLILILWLFVRIHGYHNVGNPQLVLVLLQVFKIQEICMRTSLSRSKRSYVCASPKYCG